MKPTLRKLLLKGEFESENPGFSNKSGEIIMQTFRDQTQKNVKMSFKELSHPPPEKCNSHVLAPPSNHFMQKTTCHYDDKVTKSCY